MLRTVLITFLVLGAPHLPVHANQGMVCPEVFTNIGGAERHGDGDSGVGPTFTFGTCTSPDNERFGVRQYMGGSQFSTTEFGGDGRVRTLYLITDFLVVISKRDHLHGTAGIGGYYKALDDVPTSLDAHELAFGYNAGIGIAFPRGDRPGIVLETLYHNARGPYADGFITFTIGLGKFYLQLRLL